MPPFQWPSHPIDLIQHFEAKHEDPRAGALFLWAAWAVDSLHYLDDIDRAFDRSPDSAFGRSPDVVDVSHARWATATCMTALDLCAAALGRAFCGHTGTHELDLGDFDPSSRPSNDKEARRAHLPEPACQWLDEVLADPDYRIVKAARDWLTHSRLNRHFFLNVGGAPQRLSLEVMSVQLPVRHLVELCRDLSTRHVTSLLDRLPAF